MKKQFSLKILQNIKVMTSHEQAHIKGGATCSCTEEKRRTIKI